jgi:hypothetical protein
MYEQRMEAVAVDMKALIAKADERALQAKAKNLAGSMEADLNFYK